MLWALFGDQPETGMWPVSLNLQFIDSALSLLLTHAKGKLHQSHTSESVSSSWEVLLSSEIYDWCPDVNRVRKYKTPEFLFHNVILMISYIWIYYFAFVCWGMGWNTTIPMSLTHCCCGELASKCRKSELLPIQNTLLPRLWTKHISFCQIHPKLTQNPNLIRLSCRLYFSFLRL